MARGPRLWLLVAFVAIPLGVAGWVEYGDLRGWTRSASHEVAGDGRLADALLAEELRAPPEVRESRGLRGSTSAPLESHAPPVEPTGPRDPRTAPPGTLDRNAQAFRQLPLAAKDGPPLLGVGEQGIHVDDISMGSFDEDPGCRRRITRFPIGQSTRVSVCFRVVHPRLEQRVGVVWEREGRIVRRGFAPIASAHSYRARAQLLLRAGDEGAWVVRILSSDDVELARHLFHVTD